MLSSREAEIGIVNYLIILIGEDEPLTFSQLNWVGFYLACSGEKPKRK